MRDNWGNIYGNIKYNRCDNIKCVKLIKMHSICILHIHIIVTHVHKYITYTYHRYITYTYYTFYYIWVSYVLSLYIYIIYTKLLIKHLATIINSHLPFLLLAFHHLQIYAGVSYIYHVLKCSFVWPRLQSCLFNSMWCIAYHHILSGMWNKNLRKFSR